MRSSRCHSRSSARIHRYVRPISSVAPVNDAWGLSPLKPPWAGPPADDENRGVHSRRHRPFVMPDEPALKSVVARAPRRPGLLLRARGADSSDSAAPCERMPVSERTGGVGRAGDRSVRQARRRSGAADGRRPGATEGEAGEGRPVVGASGGCRPVRRRTPTRRRRRATVRLSVVERPDNREGGSPDGARQVHRGASVVLRRCRVDRGLAASRVPRLRGLCCTRTRTARLRVASVENLPSQSVGTRRLLPSTRTTTNLSRGRATEVFL
jgi:hypothetical protein